MFLFSAIHIAVRMLGTVVLLVCSPFFVVVFLGADMLFFLCYKILRDDLRYWLKLDGMMSWLVSIVIRVITKFMHDCKSNPPHPRPSPTTC